MADPVVQKFALRALTSLPAPMLRALSGGGVVYRGGRTLDPTLQFLAYAAGNAPAPWTLTLDDARKAAADAFAAVAPKPEAGVRTETLRIDGPAGQIPLRLYRPEFQDRGAPLFVYLHLGGGVWGGLETADAFCTRLAKGAGCPVASVDYRLAPEHRFPAGLDDALAAYRWAKDHAAEFGTPAGHVAIGGESIGGNFAAVICQELKRAGEPQPALQLMIYPCTDVASETPSMTTYADAFPLTRGMMDWFMGHYLGPDDDPAGVRLSPLREEDLTGLAPAVLATAGFDPLVDQGEAYARALNAAGVTVRYRCYDSLSHAFASFTGAIPAADAACREIAGLVRGLYEE